MACSHAPVKNIQLTISAFSRPELRHVKHGENGYVISPNDEQALVDAVLDVTQSREHCEWVRQGKKKAVKL